MTSLKELSDCATPGIWYTVDPPWGDSDWINAGSEDPHQGHMVCVFEDQNDSWAEDEASGREDLPTVQDDAAFVAALVNAYRSGHLSEGKASGEVHFGGGGLKGIRGSRADIDLVQSWHTGSVRAEYLAERTRLYVNEAQRLAALVRSLGGDPEPPKVA